MKLTQPKLQAIVDEACAFFDTATSLSVSIWDGEDVTSAAAGYSNAETGALATPDTLYSIGSSTKAFTAAAIGILVDQGKIDLDEPVRKYIPEFKMYDEDVARMLTVRDTLCHRCGLPRHDLAWVMQPDLDYRALVPLIQYLPPKWPLRYHFYYNNFMFILASVLVERVSGESYDDFVKKNIFEPLGMNASYVYADQIPDDDPRKSMPHDGKDHEFHVIPRMTLRNAAGAGSIYSSTPDMIKWLRFRLHGNEKVLSDKLRKEAQSPQMLIKEGEMFPWQFPETVLSTYAMGWFVESYRDFTIIHHGGTVDGYRSMQLFVPGKDIAISALTNGNAPEATDSIAYKLVDVLLDQPDGDWFNRWKKITEEMKEEAEKGLQELKKKQEEGGVPFTIADYVGNFRHPGYGTLRLVDKDGELYTRVDSYDCPLICDEGGQFVLIVEAFGMPIPVTFKRDEAGKVTSVEIPFEPEMPDEPICFTRVE